MSGTPPGLPDYNDDDEETKKQKRNNQYPLPGQTQQNKYTLPPIRDTTSSTRTARTHLPTDVLTENAFDSYYAAEEALTRSPTSNQTELTAAGAVKESKKAIAIRELVDTTSDSSSTGPLQLPSFVSLSVVERSPVPPQANLNNAFPSKRPRLGLQTESSTYDINRLLPRPTQKDEQQTRPVPLLPAMVTGLHDPPPSAALLPSMDLDVPRPALAQRTASSSGMQVRDILSEPEKISRGRPPELMLNTPEVTPAGLPKLQDLDMATPETAEEQTSTPQSAMIDASKRADGKVRRARRKWSDAETSDLQAGVKKHGFGKWKQILNDPEFTFIDRTSIDLKDRYRVFAKDIKESPPSAGADDELQTEMTEPTSDTLSGSRPSVSAPKARRKRHPWTKEEDDALTMGVRKHGFQWTEIHNDPELGLGHRRATDLRDRIRNRHPEGYRTAETRPLRAEVKKAEKEGKRDAHGRLLVGPQTAVVDSPLLAQQTTLLSPSSASSTVEFSPPLLQEPVFRRATMSKVPTLAEIAGLSTDSSVSAASSIRPEVPRRSRTSIGVPWLEQSVEENADIED